MKVNRFISSSSNLTPYRSPTNLIITRNESNCFNPCRNIRNKSFFYWLIIVTLCLLCLRLLLLPIEWYLDRSQLNYIPYYAIKGKDCRDSSQQQQRSVNLVPKIIHQTFKSRYPLPIEWEKSTFMVHYHHSKTDRWQYRFWNDSDIDLFFRTEYPWFLPTFHSYQYPIQRADAFRYFVLYHYGGIYIDMDIGAKQSFNCLLDYPVVLPRTRPFGFSNDFLISIPKHPFYHQLIHNLPSFNQWYVFPFLTILFSTGPTFLTFHYYWIATSDILSDIFILPEKLYSTPGKAILFHVMGNSWLTWDGKIIQFFLVTHYPLFRVMMMSIMGLFVAIGIGYCLSCFFKGNSSKFQVSSIKVKEDLEEEPLDIL